MMGMAVGPDAVPFAHEAGRFFIILLSNFPMGVCGFGDAVVMHIALTLCGMVRDSGRGLCVVCVCAKGDLGSIHFSDGPATAAPVCLPSRLARCEVTDHWGL